MAKKNMICPICLRKMNRGHIRWVCRNCRTEVIPSWKERLSGRPPVCKNAGCGRRAYKVCAYDNSGKELPWDIEKYSKNLRFSVIGLTGAGKTSFLIAMLSELRYHSSLWPAMPMDEDTKIWFDISYDQFVNRHLRLDPTQPAAGENILPLRLWKIKDMARMNSKRTPTYTMTIFDGAGEECAKIRDICRGDTPIGRYLYTSKVLVVLIDPLGFPDVFENVDEAVRTRSMSARVDSRDNLSMLDELVDVIKERRGTTPEATVSDTNVAVVFTKLDVVESQFPNNARVLQQSPHISERGFLLADADEVDAEIRSWLERYQAKGFINALEANFDRKNIRFFGVSSYGQAPAQDVLPNITPRRILDPFLWMLSLEGVFPVIR